jgi:hypothetical protein
MLTQKKPLNLDDIEAQAVLELPERETPQTVIVQCLAICIGQIVLRNIAVSVAANVCLQLEAITVLSQQILECRTVGSAGAG